jgi:AP-1-like transcription factor
MSNNMVKKRKAQNRAAQRAFRERKEKHLKDLETKVQDLEKASETANHENSILRAQVEKMSAELREYRKRLSTSGNGRSPPLNGGLPPYLSGRGSNNNTVNNPNDVNFQFEFPKFGRLPGPPVLNATRLANSNSTKSTPPAPVHRASSSSNNGSIGPLDQSLQHNPSFASTFSNNNNSNTTQDTQLFGQLDSNDLSEFFTPAFDTVGNDFSLDPPAHDPSRSSTDSSRGPQSTSQSTSYSSPSASSNTGSNVGLSSSCDTSPEPYMQSPGGFKNNDNMLSTIGEEKTGTNSVEGEASFCEKLAMACGNPNNPIPRTMSESGVKSGSFQTSGFDLKTPGFDLNGIDWFAQQNGNQFDPQLFGDYREPQNNILTGGLYDDTFFAEAFALPEFNSASPFNLTASPAAPKKDLVQVIDQKLSQEEEVVPGEDRTQLLTCNTMW